MPTRVHVYKYILKRLYTDGKVYERSAIPIFSLYTIKGFMYQHAGLCGDVNLCYVAIMALFHVSLSNKLDF